MFFESVLVANRGEIACRVIRTLRALGIHSVAVYTEADRTARHVGLADTAVQVPDYLDAAALVQAATSTRAQAVHPGYGFLAENAAFARACAAAGLVFIGPSPEAIEAMGDKIRAKAHVAARGVPVIPGSALADADSAAEVFHAADQTGFPLMVKPSAGGGGKGMAVVRAAAELPEAVASARRLAAKAFGDDTLLLERLIERPRHIEVQVLADAHGRVLHLGERECSLQRRHQKIIEEAPSPLLSEQTREAIGEAACEVARSVGYLGAGTVEFLVSDAAPDEFFFLEMNTRLQVEHPVTELITGLDLVEQQLRIAAGEPLTATFQPHGHAIEARLYAEDPAAGFLPTDGTVIALREAQGPGVRVDSALAVGVAVASDYDPMLAKIVAWGADRSQAIARLDQALADTVVQGVRTNVDFLRALLADPAVRAGDLDTGLIERLDYHASPTDATALAVAALVAHADAPPFAGWRVGEHRPARYTFGDAVVSVLGGRVNGVPASLRPLLSSGATAAASAAPSQESASWVVEREGVARAVIVTRDRETIWVGNESFRLRSREELLAEHRATLSRPAGTANPEVRSAMPGTVVSVSVRDGDAVQAGQPLLAVEAMKMEHPVLAPLAGVVRLSVGMGDQVRSDQVIAVIEGAA